MNAHARTNVVHLTSSTVLYAWGLGTPGTSVHMLTCHFTKFDVTIRWGPRLLPTHTVWAGLLDLWDGGNDGGNDLANQITLGHARYDYVNNEP